MGHATHPASPLKRRGIVLLVCGFPAVGLVLEAVEDGPPLLDRATGTAALLILVYLVAANAVVVGGMLLYAGVRRLPAAQGGVKRGFVTKLIGGNLLFVAVAWVNLQDKQQLGGGLDSSWYAIVLVLLATCGLPWAGHWLIRRGAKHEALSADAALSLDDRPPVLYLRSFKDDKPVVVTGWMGRLLALIIGWIAMVSVEQDLARSLRRIGPVVAIGRPGERLPQLGASRLYVGDEAWQGEVTRLMREAALVVVRVGSTPSVWWEIEQAVAVVPLERLMLLSLGAGSDQTQIENALERRFGPIGGELDTRCRLLLGRILYFGGSSKLHAVPVQVERGWLPLAMSLVMPYRKAIDTAVNRVLRDLEQLHKVAIADDAEQTPGA